MPTHAGLALGAEQSAARGLPDGESPVPANECREDPKTLADATWKGNF